MATIFNWEILLELHKVFCDALSCSQFNSTNLFSVYVGVYGDVVRVKILFNKKDTALIQFNYVQQAQTGSFDLLNNNY